MKFIKPNYNADRILKKASMVKNNAPNNNSQNGKTQRYASADVIYGQPHFYSPLHTPQNWQIPSKRNEQYQWARFFFENEAKIGAGIQFYSEFPMQGFELQCADNKIKKYFERKVKQLKLNTWLPMISAEYFMLGDVFPFLGVECPKCKGSGNYNGATCSHEGGTFNKMVVLNPDWVEVKQNPLADEPFIQLIPDEDLKRIVMDKFPIEIYNRIPMAFRNMILAGQPIPLSNRSVTHLRHMPAPYGTYGTSILRRLFKILAYKDRLMTANWVIAERLILPVRIVKIGNDDRPAGANDIANVQQQLATVQNDPNLTLVTHHAFDYQFVGAQGSIVQAQSEYDQINHEILDGLMLPQAVLTSEMQGYQGVQIGAEILIRRLENWRNKLKEFIEEKIFAPEAQMQGFIDEEESLEAGEPIYTYPTIKWNDLNIRDDTQTKQQLLGLHDAGIISQQTLVEAFDLDYDQEVERRREEANIQATLGGGAPMQGGGMAPGGMGGGGMPPPPMGGDMPPPPDMGGMGDMGGEGMPPPGPMANNNSKVMKRKNARKSESKKETGSEDTKYTPQNIQLTSIEKIIWDKLFFDPAYTMPFQKKAQFPVANYEGQSYLLDFAIPQLKIAIEADGEIFHNDPEKMKRDKERDLKLARKGWIVLRFKEKDIENKIDNVMATIMSHVNMKANAMKQQGKQSKAASNMVKNKIDSMINIIKDS